VADPTPRTVTLPLRAWVAAAIVGVLVLAMLAGQLALLVEQRRLIDHQNKVATTQAVRARPALRTLDTLLGDSPRGALRAAQRAGSALDGIQGLLEQLRRTGLVRVTADSLPQVVDATRRTVRLLAGLAPVLRQSLSVQERSLTVAEQSLALQGHALASQRRLVALAQQTLSVAQATLGHAASIDRKTGGQTPNALP
jgi:hypothetical protein